MDRNGEDELVMMLKYCDCAVLKALNVALTDACILVFIHVPTDEKLADTVIDADELDCSVELDFCSTSSASSAFWLMLSLVRNWVIVSEELFRWNDISLRRLTNLFE